MDFIINGIFRQPPLFLGLIAFLGLLLQKKSLDQIVKGSFKTAIGVVILSEGVNVIASSIEPLAQIFTSLYGLEGQVASYIGMNGFIENYGSLIGIVMILAFGINLLVARFTKFKSIFLTGHIFFWIAFVAIAAGVESNLTGGMLIGFATIGTALYIIITPYLIKPFVKEVTGDDSFTIGHTTVGLSLMGAYVGKIFGDKSKSIEDIKVPKSLEFLRDPAVSSTLIITILYIASGALAMNLDSSLVITDYLMNGLKFGAGLTVLLIGVRMMISELVPSFKGISEKLIPNSIPALDCPLIFPYGPNGVMIGFLIALASSIFTIVIFGSMGIFTVAVIPLTVACFFDAGPAVIFANATGGRRGAIIAAILCGVVMVTLQGFSMIALSSTVPDFLQAFGGNDFSILALIMEGIGGLVG